VPSPQLVAVVDMGASAVRLVIAEIGADRSIRTIEDASRGILLGRDTFVRRHPIHDDRCLSGGSRQLSESY
jgi:exopolyphosphatase/pppGpp-phosphohydrolase